MKLRAYEIALSPKNPKCGTSQSTMGPLRDGADEIKPSDIREIPLVTIPLVATAILSLIMGIFPEYFLTLARGVVP